ALRDDAQLQLAPPRRHLQVPRLRRFSADRNADLCGDGDQHAGAADRDPDWDAAPTDRDSDCDAGAADRDSDRDAAPTDRDGSGITDPATDLDSDARSHEDAQADEDAEALGETEGTGGAPPPPAARLLPFPPAPAKKARPRT